MEYITSKDNSKIKNFAKLLSDKKKRMQTGLFVCEGEKVLYETMELGAKIDTIIISENFTPKVSLDKYNVICVPNYLLEKISDTKTPQGVMFSCKMIDFDVDFNDVEKVLILDGVRDPGNMGTIIRTAVAFGIECIILLNNSVDPYSPKVVRSTMTGVFKIPIVIMSIEECFEKIKLPVFATFLDEKSLSITNVDMKKCAVIIGNEASGVSKEVLEYADEKIIIPIKNIESLNAAVAASVVMWEMSK